MTQREIGIAGWKNSGKTTLTKRLATKVEAAGTPVFDFDAIAAMADFIETEAGLR